MRGSNQRVLGAGLVRAQRSDLPQSLHGPIAARSRMDRGRHAHTVEDVPPIDAALRPALCTGTLRTHMGYSHGVILVLTGENSNTVRVRPVCTWGTLSTHMGQSLYSHRASIHEQHSALGMVQTAAPEIVRLRRIPGGAPPLGPASARMWEGMQSRRRTGEDSDAVRVRPVRAQQRNLRRSSGFFSTLLGLGHEL